MNEFVVEEVVRQWVQRSVERSPAFAFGRRWVIDTGNIDEPSSLCDRFEKHIEGESIPRDVRHSIVNAISGDDSSKTAAIWAEFGVEDCNGDESVPKLKNFLRGVRSAISEIKEYLNSKQIDETIFYLSDSDTCGLRKKRAV